MLGKVASNGVSSSRMSKWSAVLFLSLFFSSLFFSALLSPDLSASESLTESDYFSDVPLVMVASRLPQSLSETPIATTVINRKMIEASGFIEIPDLLRLVPGFQVGLSWRDHHSAVTYHGQSDGLSRRMQVLIDGRMALGTLFGLVDWDRLGITVDDIDRIEVVRGPAGVAYGSNAFIGAINIITRTPYSESGWRFRATSGSNDTSQFEAKYSEVGEKFDYRASFNYFDTDGFDDVNDESRSRAVRFQGRYQIQADTLLDFQLGQAEGPWGRGGSGLPVDPVADKEARERYGNIRLTHAMSPGNEFYFQVGFSETEEDDDVNVGLLSTVLMIDPTDIPVLFDGRPDQDVDVSAFDFVSDRFDVEFQHQLTLGDVHRAVWGVGYRKDSVDGLSTIGRTGREEIETWRGYGNLELHLTDSILFNAGLTLEDNRLNDMELSTRTGLNITLAPGHVLRLSVAESYRQPFVAEAFHNVAIRFDDGSVLEQIQLAPTPLEPERLRSFELGYLGVFFDQAFRIEAKAFREEFEEEIEFVLNPFFPEPVSIFNPGTILDLNGAKTDITGVEFGFSWRVGSATQLWGSYAFAEVDQTCQPGAFRCDFASNDATPRHTANLLLSRDLSDDWQISMGYYYLDDTAWVLWGCDLATGDCDADSYSRVDARLAKTFHLADADFILELIGQNLGGDYKEFHNINNFETRTFLRATLQYH